MPQPDFKYVTGFAWPAWTFSQMIRTSIWWFHVTIVLSGHLHMIILYWASEIVTDVNLLSILFGILSFPLTTFIENEQVYVARN